MIFQSAVFAIVLMLTLIVLLCTIGYTLKNLRIDLHRYLLYCEIVVLILLIFFTLSFTVPQEIKYLTAYGIFASLSACTGLLLFAGISFIYGDRVKGAKWMYIFFIIPVITLLGVLTDHWLHLLYIPISTPNGLIFERNIVAHLTNYYGYVADLTLFIICIYNIPRVSSRKRRALIFFIIMAVLTAFIEVIGLSGIFSINLSPLALVLTVIGLFCAIYFTDFFEKSTLGLKTFVENANTSFVFLDANFNFVSFNPKFKEFGGTDDLIGMNAYNLNLNDDFRTFLDSDLSETKIFDKKHNMWVKATRTDVIEDDELLGYLLVFEDITEDTLKTQNLEYLRSVVADVESTTLMAINYQDSEGKYHWSDVVYQILERDPRPEDVYIDIIEELVIESKFGDLNEQKNTLKDDEVKVGEFKIKTESGKIKYIAGTLHKIYDNDGNFNRLTMSVQDITEKAKNTRALAKSDAEKTVLLKEIHHRVKNNLQLISSFINLEKKFHMDDPERIINVTEDRISSLALIHERIYNEDDMNYIQTADFFEDFDNNLYVFSDVEIEFIRDIADDLTLSVDIMTPITLIVNELTTNTFKYAFRDDFQGDKIIYKSIKFLEKEGKKYCEFKYSDSGLGLEEGFDIKTTPSLGWKIIISLVGQLDGEYELFNDNGLNFVLTFPIK